MTEEILVVFDFDWSLVDQDTDRYVFEVLAPQLRQRLEDEKKHKQWTDLIDESLGLLHEQGFKRADVERALQILPFHPAMQRGVRCLKKRRKVTLLCCSNSNSVFINTILRHHAFTDIFDEIVTNTAEWHSERLFVRRRTPPDGPQHGCEVGCSANMCKGTELQKFFASRGGIERYKTCVFVGDGSNDLCGLLQLRPQDFGFVRSGRELEKRIDKEGEQWGLRCGVKKWEEAWECERLLDAL